VQNRVVPSLQNAAVPDDGRKRMLGGRTMAAAGGQSSDAKRRLMVGPPDAKRRLPNGWESIRDEEFRMSERAQYARMLRDANHEARVTVGALVATIVVWIVLGFGLSGSSIEVFHTPLWVVMGTVGTWVFAIIVSIVLARHVLADADFEVATRLAEQDAARAVAAGAQSADANAVDGNAAAAGAADSGAVGAAAADMAASDESEARHE
jgi:uncharacterized membrane protein YhdT